MLLFRCAWHWQYRGFPMVYAVASWRGFGVQFSDGICGPCARRWRVESQMGPRGVKTAPLIPSAMPRAGVALALAIAVVFTARPVSHHEDMRFIRASSRIVVPAASDRATAAVSDHAPLMAAKPEPPTSPRTVETSPRTVVKVQAAKRRSIETTHATATIRSAPAAHRTETPANRLTLASRARRTTPPTAGVIPASMPDIEPRRLPFSAAWAWVRDNGARATPATSTTASVSQFQSP